MKRRSFSLLLALLLVLCGGCEKRPPEPADTVNPQQAEQDIPEESPGMDIGEAPSPHPESGEPVDYHAVYAPALDAFCDIIYNGNDYDKEYIGGTAGVAEMRMWTEAEELLELLGYTIRDVSGDEIPELLIGVVVSEGEKSRGTVLAGYTVKDSEPFCFLEGWGRSSYEWLGDGRFTYYGSNGAMSSVFGTYHVSRDGTELECEDYYFTDVAGEDPAALSLYHNTSGEWDIKVSEQLDISEDEFWQIQKGYQDEGRLLALTPFREYPFEPETTDDSGRSAVRVEWAVDALQMLPRFEDVSNSSVPAEDKVVFIAREPVRDFTVLSLAFLDVDDDGHAIYDISEGYSQAELTPALPLAIPMSFPGDIPSSGFSYVGEDGGTRRFSVSVSGKDGSLVVLDLDR